MNRGLKIIPAAQEHIAPIAEKMREADRQEVWASSRATPVQALEYSLKKSSLGFAYVIDGEPCAMMGVGDVNILAGIGAPWLLATQRAVENWRGFLRLSRRGMDLLRGRYRLLSNYVDGRNEVSIRYLKWLGFELKEPVIFNDVEFWRFEMRGHQEAWRGEASTGNEKTRR